MTRGALTASLRPALTRLLEDEQLFRDSVVAFARREVAPLCWREDGAA